MVPRTECFPGVVFHAFLTTACPNCGCRTPNPTLTENPCCEAPAVLQRPGFFFCGGEGATPRADKRRWLYQPLRLHPLVMSLQPLPSRSRGYPALSLAIASVLMWSSFSPWRRLILWPDRRGSDSYPK